MTYAQEMDSTYPYTSSAGATGICKYKAGGLVTTTNPSYTMVTGNPTAMQSAVTIKPNSVAI